MKCTWITECYYPAPEYNRFNPFERRKVYLNQQDQKKHAGGRNGGGPCSDKPREIQEFSTVISELSALMASEDCEADYPTGCQINASPVTFSPVSYK